MAENTTHDELLDRMEAQAPESMHPLLEAAYKYRTQLSIAVAVIIGITAIYAGVTAYNKKALNTAQANLGAILIQSQGENRLQKLEELLNMAPSSATAAVQLEIAQTCMQLGQYDKAADYWGRLVGDTDADMQVVARLGKAKALLLSGKATEATAELKDLVGIAPEPFSTPVYRQLAMAAETAGDTAEALDAYKKLQELSPGAIQFIDYKISKLEAQ